MKERNLSRSRPQLTSLRLGKITVAMAVAMLAGLGLGLAAMAVDTMWLSPPPVVLGTVEASRVMMGSVIAGLITVGVFGLWMRTVVVGLMAAHFSPRTLLVFLDDNFQRNLLAFMSSGAVTVMVILLRMPSDGQAPTPLVSTVLTILIVLAALAGILLAIQQSTRSLSLPELISRLADDALKVLDRQPEARVELTEVPPASEARMVLALGTGWVTSIDIDQMRKALPAGGTIHLRCRIGEFVTPRRPVALVSLAEADGEANVDAIAESVSLARTRSPDLDLAFAVGQLVDVGSFALESRSDTATAHEVMVHLENILEEIVDCGLPRLHDLDEEGRCVYDEVGWDAVDLVQLCMERLRQPVARDPETTRHLMHMLRRVRQVAQERQDLAVVTEIGRQVELVLALAHANGMLARDYQQLERKADSVVYRSSS